MNSSLIHLLHITDPTLPIGGFSHSAGLETYVQQGIVKDVDTTQEFVIHILRQNIQYTDAAFVSLTYQAAIENNFDTIFDLDIECTAVKIPFEIKQASAKLGIRFLKIFQSICNNKLINDYVLAVQNKATQGNYCVAFALCAYALGIQLEDALTGFYYNAAVGFITNAVKLVPLSQQSGQQILFVMQNTINELVQKSMHPNRDLLGLCCTSFDIKSMQHERLYSRLYMS